jgi:hypothetical protein
MVRRERSVKPAKRAWKRPACARVSRISSLVSRKRWFVLTLHASRGPLHKTVTRGPARRDAAKWKTSGIWTATSERPLVFHGGGFGTHFLRVTAPPTPVRRASCPQTVDMAVIPGIVPPFPMFSTRSSDHLFQYSACSLTGGILQ